MIRSLRRYLGGLLVLALVLTGHSMAVARGMPGASGYAEYCIGETAVMIAVDADGNPTGESHICPDFSLSLLNAVATDAPVILAPVVKAEQATIVVVPPEPLIRIFKGAARAPPVLA